MIKIQQTSLFVLNKLNEIIRTGTSPEDHFFVHSAYERTINLMIGGQLIALQVKDSPVSPISVILPLNSTEIRDLDAHEGQEIFLEENNIVIGKTTITFDASTDVYDGYLNKYNFNADMKHLIKPIIEKAHRGGFSFLTDPAKAPDDLVLSYVKQKLKAVITYIHCGKTEAAAEAISSLIGVGTGLTPSGDDFITGMLSAFSAFPEAFNQDIVEQIRNSVSLNLQNTNEISMAFIKCALDNQFSVPVISLYQWLCSENGSPEARKSQSDKILQSFLAIGHSSGIDTLTGIWWALENLL